MSSQGPAMTDAEALAILRRELNIMRSAAQFDEAREMEDAIEYIAGRLSRATP